MLKVGVAKAEITAAAGCALAGYSGRPGPALGVRDPLWARAIVFDNGAQVMGVVVLDLIDVSPELVAETRALAAERTGIEASALMVSATHTHTGPSQNRQPLTETEEEYWRSLPRIVAGSVSDACAALQPACLRVARGWSAIGINRREEHPNGLVWLGKNEYGRFDTEVGILRVNRATGEPLAAVVNYACHAVALGGEVLLSADYPGFMVRQLEQSLGVEVALFLQGATGNVDPRAPGTGYFVGQRIGEILATEVERNWSTAQGVDTSTCAVLSRSVKLPTNRKRAAGIISNIWWQSRDAIDKRIAGLAAAGDAPVEAEIQAMALGPVALMGWPGEIFCELGLAAKEQSPFPWTFVVGYANGNIGYLPTASAFREGGYEVACGAHFDDRAGDCLVDASIALLQELSPPTASPGKST